VAWRPGPDGSEVDRFRVSDEPPPGVFTIGDMVRALKKGGVLQ
jgi:hypothetical protein